MSSRKMHKKVLVSPLDWGLGHATRCIPIIKTLINKNIEVWIAAEGQILSLLQKEFPNLNYLHLRGYRIKYSKKRQTFFFRMALQIPKILTTYFYEKRWLKKAQLQYQFDAVISDNRPGLVRPKIPCIYITHQLNIKTGIPILDPVANKLHHYFIRKFTEWWVPDAEENGLAGALARPKNISKKIHYIGPLSRMDKCGPTQNNYELLCILSGPEPQRTLLEKILIREATALGKKTLFVRGLPSPTETPPFQSPGIEFKNHLAASALNHAICTSKVIVSRCGYTTVMDLAKLQKPAILIPTPGQAEQEYLAIYLSEKSYFITARQQDFSLREQLNKLSRTPLRIMDINFNHYKTLITQLVTSLK